MRLVFGFDSDGQFTVTAEARILMPFGRETLHWMTSFDDETQFLRLAVTAPLSESDMAKVLAESIRAASVMPGAPHPTVDLDLNEEQFSALGLNAGVCVVPGKRTAA